MIRNMTVADAEPIVAIITQHEAWDEPYARQYYTDYFESKAKDPELAEENFVAEIDGEVVGVCGYGPPKFPAEDVLWGTWFYVDERFRAKGVGRQLIEKTIQAVRSHDARKLYLETSSSDLYAGAVEFYKQNGFVIEGQLVDFYEEGEDVIIMGVEL